MGNKQQASRLHLVYIEGGQPGFAKTGRHDHQSPLVTRVAGGMQRGKGIQLHLVGHWPFAQCLGIFCLVTGQGPQFPQAALLIARQIVINPAVSQRHDPWIPCQQFNLCHQLLQALLYLDTGRVIHGQRPVPLQRVVQGGSRDIARAHKGPAAEVV